MTIYIVEGAFQTDILKVVVAPRKVVCLIKLGLENKWFSFGSESKMESFTLMAVSLLTGPNEEILGLRMKLIEGKIDDNEQGLLIGQGKGSQ